MMRIKIVFLSNLFNELKKSLKWDGKEKIVYALCHSSRHDDNIKLLPCTLLIPDESDYIIRSSGYLKIKKKFLNRVINLAILSGSDVIQIHIHPPGAGGRFSPVDKHDEPNIMKHVADQVRGIYHASMVFSHDFQELDSYFYDRKRDKVIPVQKILVIGKNKLEVLIPKGAEDSELDLGSWMDRTIQAYGVSAVQKIGLLDVGVVGASALGGPIIEMLSRYGFNSISICDPDRIEESNLNRLVGTTPKDIGKPKVDFYAEYAERINPAVAVNSYKKSFYDLEVQKAFAQMDIILGCVDSGARFSINRLALANLIPYFDMGAGIVRNNGKVEFKGGQIFSIIPGRSVCLECSGVFNNLKTEFWSTEKRERERKQGYLNDDAVINPLVADLDSVIAGHGFHEMLSYIWGQGSEAHFKLYCDMVQNKMMTLGSTSKGCIYCREEELLGTGAQVSPLVPAKDEALDIPSQVDAEYA